MFRKIFVTAAVLVGVVFAMPAGAQSSYVPPTNVTTTNPSPGPGEGVTFAGACVPGDSITVSLDGSPLGSTECSDGVFSITVTIPADLSAGSHTLVVAGTGGVASTTTFTVGAIGGGSTGGGATAGGATLPRTGGDPFPTAQLALGLIAVGGALVLFARKRNAAAVTG